ncbi:hypothetical protein ABEX29_01030 [Brevibacillus porteri]|uniref:hypothetical protein n=1 Tax=Brevibacillus porteri TaxID=2126350 RepID=UPI003D1A1E77
MIELTPQREKLQEAEHFYQEMVRESQAEEYKRFRHALSAFVNAGRSVLQYTHKDAGALQKMSEYNALIAGNQIIRFFKGIRDINIHEKPIGTHCEGSASLSAMMAVRTPDMSDEDVAELTKVSRVQEQIGTTTEIRYLFDDWEGPEDVLVLSDKYLKELKDFVNAAESRGLIRGT